MKGNLIVGAAAFIASWALIGCSSGSQRPGSDQPSLVWIAQTYSGGRQCEPREDYAAPETRSVLEEAGVTVYETAARADPVCMACGCPAYAATHYAQIQSSDVDRAARLGFERSAPPEKVGSAMGAGSAALTGRVLYRERIALPADAVVRVRLVEAGEIAPSALAEQTIRPRGQQVPIPFTLAYDSADIDPSVRYGVRADIRGAGGELLWTTDADIEVITQGAPREDVEAVVRQAPADGMPPLPTGRALVYGCDTPGGESFTFTVRPGPGEVGIALPERFERRSLVLPQVRADGGSKFEGDGVLFWVSGERIRLDVDGETFTCAERPPGEGEAPEPGVAFRAVGQEPFWSLEIVPERHIHFRYAVGEREVYTPVPEADDAEGRTIYHAVTEAHDLRVIIEDTPCNDVMSGALYEATVTVMLDGETYRGCGHTP